MLCHLGASLYDLHENEEAVRVYSKALELAEYTALRGTLLYNRAISYGSVGLKKAGGGSRGWRGCGVWFGKAVGLFVWFRSGGCCV